MLSRLDWNNRGNFIDEILVKPDQDKQSGGQDLCEKVSSERLPEEKLDKETLIDIAGSLVNIVLEAVADLNNRVEIEISWSWGDTQITMAVQCTMLTCVFDSPNPDEYLGLYSVHDQGAALGAEGVEEEPEVTGPFCHQLPLTHCAGQKWETRDFTEIIQTSKIMLMEMFPHW